MIKGIFYDGHDSRQRPACLIAGHANVQVCNAGDNREVFLSVPVSAMIIEPKLGKLPRTIKFGDNSIFETTDQDAVDQLSKRLGASDGNWLHWLESHTMPVIGMLVGMTVITWGIIQYGIPATAKWVSYQLPAGLYQEAGDHTISYLDKFLLEPTQLPEERRQTLRKAFLSQLDKTEKRQNIRVMFRDGGAIGANAFALPSGIVVFTDQMVNLACDDQELLAIFGHEVGHIQERHLTRKAIQASIVGVTIAMLLGDASGLGEIIVTLPAVMLEMSYSRGFEQEADDYALDFLRQRDIETGYFTSIMERLTHQSYEPAAVEAEQGQNNRFEDYLSTHPLPEERLEKFGPPAPVACAAAE